MSPCRAAVTLVLFPLTFGMLVGWAVVNSWLTAYEDAQRERRRREEERVTQVTEAGNMEVRWFIWEGAHNGQVIEWLHDGMTVNTRN